MNYNTWMSKLIRFNWLHHCNKWIEIVSGTLPKSCFSEMNSGIVIFKIYFLVCYKYFLWHWIKSCDFCWQDPNRFDVFRICLEAELVPLNVQDFRRKLLFLQKLQFDIVQKSIPVGPFTLVSGESFNNMLKVFWW